MTPGTGLAPTNEISELSANVRAALESMVFVRKWKYKHG